VGSRRDVALAGAFADRLDGGGGKLGAPISACPDRLDVTDGNVTAGNMSTQASIPSL
jgi:hypothetical protein